MNQGIAGSNEMDEPGQDTATRTPQKWYQRKGVILPMGIELAIEAVLRILSFLALVYIVGSMMIPVVAVAVVAVLIALVSSGVGIDL